MLLAAGLIVSSLAHGQQAAPLDAEKGKVVFSSDRGVAVQADRPDAFPRVPVTNEERAGVVIEATDLDLHLTPSEAREEAHAVLTVRNASGHALERLPLQISSSLRWSSFATVDRKPQPIAFTQSPITTDADHTGYAQEAVLMLAHPLSAGGTVVVSAFYAGQVPQSTARLELIGTPHEKAAETDWDAIVPTSDDAATALRGFGQVLWYPVAAPTVLLGEGNQLVEGVSRQKLANETATIHLRLTLEYRGDPPDAVVFNGKLHPLARVPDTVDQVIDESRGVATADFPETTIGFRTPSLFLTAQKPEGRGAFLTVISTDPESANPYAAAAQALSPLFEDWLAEDPSTSLLLLEHAGSPYADGPFIAAQLSRTARPEAIAPELVRGLTHAWFSDTAPAGEWLDAGVPEFMSLLWTERSVGRDSALQQLSHNALTLALASPDLGERPDLPGEPLVHASSDVALRLKSAAILWQLREILGEESFRKGMKGYRQELLLNLKQNREQNSFEKSLEKTSGKDLGWFFNDWVYHDRGLPDLTITQINPRPLPVKGGVSGGYLVVVEVRNDGFAAAEVPVTVRAGDTQSVTERLRIAGRSSASTRILFQGTPKTVQVNDGGVPELRESVHTLPIVITPAP